MEDHKRDLVFRTPPLDAVRHLTSAGHFSCARRLFTAYAGPAIEVRRDSDNAVKDIYIAGRGSGYLDLASLIAHCSGANGFVSKWYDHAGNSRTASQTTAGLQAKIYDSSTGVLTENGLPVAVLDGTDDRYNWTPGLTTSTSPALTWAYASKCTNPASAPCHLKIGGNGTSGAVVRNFQTTTISSVDLNGSANSVFTLAHNPDTAISAYTFNKALNTNVNACTGRQDFTGLSQTPTGSQTLSLNSNSAQLGGGTSGAGGFQFPWAGSINCWFLVQNTLTADEQKAVDLCLAQHLNR